MHSSFGARRNTAPAALALLLKLELLPAASQRVAHEARALAAREVPSEKALRQAAAILLSHEGVLETLFAGEELEIRGVDPALANALIDGP
jgi:hypothetical protein